MEGEWYLGGREFWWLMGIESTGPPAAALGLWRWEGVLTNCSAECSGFSRMDQETVSSLEQSNQEGHSRKDQVAEGVEGTEGARCSSTEEWIQRMWYIHIMEYYTAIKNNEFMKFLGKWMN